MRSVPDLPWNRIGVDLFEYAGSSYLVAYDAFSNFPEVEKLRGVTSAAVVEKLSSLFSRHGIPLEVCSDNGPQFSSHEFQQFAHKYDFVHTTSSPRFPRSNGLAEKGVQIVKRIFEKNDRRQRRFLAWTVKLQINPPGRWPEPEPAAHGTELAVSHSRLCATGPTTSTEALPAQQSGIYRSSSC